MIGDPIDGTVVEIEIAKEIDLEVLLGVSLARLVADKVLLAAAIVEAVTPGGTLPIFLTNFLRNGVEWIGGENNNLQLKIFV